MNEKVRENRLRRMAHRQGMRVEKSRTRDRRGLEYDKYKIVNIATDSTVAGRSAFPSYTLSLDEVEGYLQAVMR